MTNKSYDLLNKVQRWLPAVGILYLTISQIWDLPFGSQINETIVAVATCMATILEISTTIYNKEDKDE